MLSGEYEARQAVEHDGEPKDVSWRLREYQDALESTRHLARALSAQGLDEQAARFALRARRMERSMFFLRRNWGAFLYSSLAEGFNRYGSQPERGALWLIAVALLVLLTRQYSRRKQ